MPESRARAIRCDVCWAADGVAAPSGRPRSVAIDGRTLRLCPIHAALVAARAPKTWDELRALFVPPGERRSFLARRTGEERRVFARPEGRRRGAGRRAGDRAA